jgi:hypothetical protein
MPSCLPISTLKGKKRGKSWAGIKKEDCGKIKETRDFSSTDTHKTNTMTIIR